MTSEKNNEMEDLKRRFHAMYPDKYFLDYEMDELTSFLEHKNWLLQGEQVMALEKPGEGNMNRVLRVLTGKRSFILKQARPWVEKYPGIDASVERNAVEAKYYAFINQDEKLKKYSPGLTGVDEDHFIMNITDLGEGTDYTRLYQKEKKLSGKELKSILHYLSILHNLHCDTFPSNMSMRNLNHEHVFVFPFSEDNGFDLDGIEPGLQKASIPYKRDFSLKHRINELGNLYLSAGKVLIHGDYFPGSWLSTDSGLKVIDPEFSFIGFAEFDLGVLIAHMLLAHQDADIIGAIIQDHEKRESCNLRITAGFAGTEVLRRLLGVAQLPLSLSLEEKVKLMKRAASWILNEKMDIE